MGGLKPFQDLVFNDPVSLQYKSVKTQFINNIYSKRIVCHQVELLLKSRSGVGL